MAQQTTLPIAPNGRLVQRRSELAHAGLYLGNKSVRQCVEWKRTPGAKGNAHQLVMKDCHATAGEDAPAPGDPAPLVLFARVSDDNFFMTSDANWRPSQYTPFFSDAKPSCTLTAPPGSPDLAILEPDWPEVIANLRWFQNRIVTKGFTESRGLLVEEDRNVTLIKIKHKLFDRDEDQRRSDNDDNDDGNNAPGQFPEEGNDDLGPAFDIANWPCWTDEAKAAIEELKDTHRVVPIPIYDKEDMLVEPSRYRTVLQGAVVEVHFTIQHWSISKRGKSEGYAFDAFSADVVSIKIVKAPPPPTPNTPRNRKISMVNPMSPKRRRLGMLLLMLAILVVLILRSMFQAAPLPNAPFSSSATAIYSTDYNSPVRARYIGWRRL
ncbi:hypothetical protein CERSUDRAFT_72610 [Gelatoporia subvermispora B]|uniref:Uncharacterized protein n=1 Tax=Ceriporiopsis subvermispora (strain B) TaxID=914234 RepID=M2R0F6_CERS8|nr:hypothetical protein CERSUDRAFT_72610 [Gelatoporia subvermispora B]